MPVTQKSPDDSHLHEDGECREYEVTWSNLVSGMSADDAVRQCLEMMRDPEGRATIFRVEPLSENRSWLLDVETDETLVMQAGEKAPLIEHANGEYSLRKEHRSVWVTIGNISVYLQRTDEGVVVDLFPAGHEMEEPLASTYAHFAEAERDDG